MLEILGMIVIAWLVIALLKTLCFGPELWSAYSSNDISGDEFLRAKKLLEENERLKELADCGCELCLAHNNMICPKLAKVESGGEK